MPNRTLEKSSTRRAATTTKPERHVYGETSYNQWRTDLRERVLPPKSTKARIAHEAWESAKVEARNKVLRLLRRKNPNGRAFIDWGYEIHVAACRYQLHSLGYVTKLAKIDGHVVREAEREKTAADCLKRLKNSIESSDYVWAKAWAAISPSAREALVRGNRSQSVPIFARTPKKQQIEPLLAAAIRFAGRKHSPSEETRDDLLVTIMLAYGKLTGQPPKLSRSAENRTAKFLRSIEEAYKDFLPDGFNIPWKSHSKLDQLRLRAVTLLIGKN